MKHAKRHIPVQREQLLDAFRAQNTPATQVLRVACAITCPSMREARPVEGTRIAAAPCAELYRQKR
jgi:hypothetical protein